MGKDEDYRFFQDRSYNYRNVFNKETHFFHPKDKDGKFIEPFDYIFSGGIGARAYFDENNAWARYPGDRAGGADLPALELPNASALPRLLDELAAAGCPLHRLNVGRQNLEQLFMP